MRLAARALLVPGISCALATPASAQAMCLYMLLTSSHTAMETCSDTLTPDAEARYQAAIAKLAPVAVHSVPALKDQDPEIWSNKVQQHARDTYKAHGGDVCKNRYYPLMKATVARWSAPEAAAKIDEIIKAQAAKDNGICL